MQWVTPLIRRRLRPVEQVLRETFILALFQGLGEGTPRKGVTRLPLKQAGLDLPDPMKTASDHCTASCVITGHLVAALRDQEEFRMADHSACLQEGRMVVRKRSVLLAEESLAKNFTGGPV